jgi:hypothetical protein
VTPGVAASVERVTSYLAWPVVDYETCSRGNGSTT